MPTARANAVAVATDTGKVYVLGGMDGVGGSPLTANEMYDPVTDAWTTRAALPTGRQMLGAVFLNGKIYVVGGTDKNQATLQLSSSFIFGGAALAQVDVYDVATDTWSSISPLPAPVMQNGAVVFQGKICVLNGTNVGGPPNVQRFQVYDPATAKWSLGPFTLGVTSSCSAVLAGEVVYFDGGSFFTCGSLAQINPTPAVGTTMLGQTSVPAQVSGTGFLGRLYMIGGDWGNVALSSVYSVDPATLTPGTAPPSSLFQHAPLAVPRAAAAVAASGGKLYVFGGLGSTPVMTPFGTTSSWDPLGTVEEFTP
jgi:hypothetical protein